MFPSISAEDFQKLMLQKIAVLEIEVFQLKANKEVNLQHGMNNTTFPQTLGSGQDCANKRLSNVNITPRNESQVDEPVRILGAKPKQRTDRITGRTLCPDITDMAAWPALPPRHSTASTPLQPWTTVKGKKAKAKMRIEDIPPEKRNVLPGNRFAPLLAEAKPTCSSDVRDNISSSPNRVRRTQRNSIQFKDDHFLPEILIVGDGALQDVKSMRKRSARVICFPNLMVSDMNDRIVDLVAAHPTVKTLILHVGTRDTKKGQSEILKEHFKALFSTLSSLSVDVYISGPFPPMPTRGSAMSFSRLYALSEWLLTTCTERSVHFIDNFNFLWDRKHLFRDGIRLNRAGIKLFLANLFHSIGSSAPVNARSQECKTKDSGPAKLTPAAEGGFITTVGAIKTIELRGDNDGVAKEEDHKEMPPSGGEVETATGGDQEEDDTAVPTNGEEANSKEATTGAIGPQEANPNNDCNREIATETATDRDGEMSINEEVQCSSVSSVTLSPMPLLEFTGSMNDLIVDPPVKRQAPPPPSKESGPPPIPPRPQKSGQRQHLHGPPCQLSVKV